jgi:hypothetical protein
MTTDVYDPNGKFLGGFACEYSGSGPREQAEKSVEGSIDGIIERRNFGKTNGGVKMYQDNVTDKGYKYHPGKIFEYQGLKVTDNHGTVLTAICFVSYKFPDLKHYNGRKTRKTRKNK